MAKPFEERVKEIISEQLGVEEDKVIPTAKFIEDLGADSLDTVELVMALEEEFHREIPSGGMDQSMHLLTARGNVDAFRPTKGEVRSKRVGEMNSLAKKAKCFVVVAVLAGLVLDVSAAQAVPIEFNFEGLAPTTSNGTISTYMSGVYGSTIVANDVDVSSNSSPSKTWTGNTTQWLINSAGSGDLEIHFKNRPIEKLFGTTRGYVFAATDGADFVIKAYDSGFGDIENPNAAASVFQQSFSVASAGTEVDIPDVVFSRPVSLLVFSDRDESDVDHGEFHVGIDDLTVQPVQPVAAVPEPATLALLGSGLVGLGFLGRKRWFRTVKS